jgi:type II secretory pathway predicted ATPase ExeA
VFLDFYRLRQQPFGVTPDPAYLYPTRTHREALSSLSAGIKEGRGFLALIAEPGMGKTTVLYQLLDELHDSARTVFLFQTQCDSREFFQYLLSELGVDTRGMDLVTMHGKLNEVLFAELVAGRRFVLVVDEAQNLEPSVLETVRLLSNFETSHTKMLQIVLAGQPQLAEKLAQPQLAQLRQRIAVLARLEPLSAAETANYIEHRLKVAGYCGAPLFLPEAVGRIAQHSQGIPRNINNLSYRSLEAAHARGIETIGAEIVQQVAAGLDLGPILAPPAAAAASVASDAEPILAAPAAPQQHEPVVPHQPALHLTYESGRRFRLPRWAARAIVLLAILFVAGVSLTAFMLRLTEPGQEKSVHVLIPSGAARPRALSAPAAPAVTYSADPQETKSSQVITVAAMPGQTLEQISLLYVGHFDPELLQQISALNPELKDLSHLDPGQLIRLPLPPGSFRKGKGLTSEK